MGFSHLVYHWLYGHLHHSACMLVARLQLRKVGISRPTMFANANRTGLYLASSSIKQDVSASNRTISMGVSNIARARWHRLASWSMLLNLSQDYRAILTATASSRWTRSYRICTLLFIHPTAKPANKTRTASPT